MAISFVVQRVLGTVTGASTVVATPGTASSIARGNTLLLYVVSDNSNTGGVAPVVEVEDPRGNQWKFLGQSLRDPGAADEGVWVSLWQCYVGYTYQDLDPINIVFNATMSRVAVCIQEWAGVSPLTYPNHGPISANGNGTSATAGLLATPLTPGSLVVALTGVETNVAITGDADVFGGGPWSALVQATSDSGVAATSIALAIQTKVITNNSGQQNTMTWAGAADWASLAFSLAAAPTPTTFTSVVGNPNYPCIIGPEILPVRDVEVPIDTGTMHIIGHFLQPNILIGTSEYTVAASYVNPNIRQQHTVIYELWTLPQLAAAVEDQITTLRLPLRTVTLDVNASVVGGGSAVDALRSIGGSYITIDGSVTNNMQTLRFDTTQLADYAGSTRVVRVGIQYLGWKDDSSPPVPGEGINVRWDDTLAPEVQSSNPGFWLTPDYRRNARVITKWFGEINAIPRGTLTPAGTPLSVTTHRAPFTLLDLEHMDSGDETTSVVIRGLQGYDLLQTAINLDFIEMVVELVPERRTAAIARRIQNLEPDQAGYGADITSHMLDVIDTANSKALNDSVYYLTVREALPASSSDQLRADPTSGTLTRYSTFEAIGPSVEMKAVGQPRSTLRATQPLEKALVANGVFRGSVSLVNDYVLSMVGFDQFAVGAYGAMMVGYEGVSRPSSRRVYLSTGKASYLATDGSTTFDHIKLLVKPDAGTTLDLNISVEQPLATPLATATVTVADAEAAPDRGYGWKEVSVFLSSPVSPAAGAVVLVFTSSTPSTAPWWLGAALPTGDNYVYGYLPNIFPNADPLVASRRDDIAAVLACELPIPTLTLGDGDVSFPSPDTFCLDTDTLAVPELTISDIADYDHVLVERETNNSGEWSTVALLHESDGTLVSPFYDVGAPWDVSLRYRVTGFRDSDRSMATSAIQAWASSPNPAPGAAFGLADEDSNLFLYVPISEREMEMVWTSLDAVDNLQQHGVDYSVAMRAFEDRGLQVSLEVQVANFEVCSPAELPEDYPENLPEPGGKSFTPHPFARLRELQKNTRMELVLPGGHTRYVSLALGPMTVHTAHAVYKAELVLTDVRPPDSNPWPNG